MSATAHNEWLFANRCPSHLREENPMSREDGKGRVASFAGADEATAY